MQPPSTKLVGIVVAATIVLTAFHFTDNIVNVDTYPRQDWLSATAIQVAGLIFWPAMALLGVLAYRAYRDGRFPRANWMLAGFSYLGLVSFLHFTAGSPDELTTRGLISVIIDVTAGLTVLGVAVWSFLARREPATASTAAN